MIDTPIWVAVIGGLAAVIAALSLYVQARQRLAFDRETARRKSEDETRKTEAASESEKRRQEQKIIQLMVDDFQGLREEAGDYNKEKRALWDKLGEVQRAHFDCEARCSVLARKVHELEHEVSDLKTQYQRLKQSNAQEAT